MVKQKKTTFNNESDLKTKLNFPNGTIIVFAL